MNKFLSGGSSSSSGSGGNTESVAVDDGSTDIYGKTLGAANLIPDLPLSVNTDRQLYSTSSLKVSDIETDDHFSVNGELQKIYNIQSATETAPYITEFQGEIHVDRVKKASHRGEIEFDSTGDLNLSCGDAINITSTADTINLNGTIINAQANIKMGSNEIQGNSTGKIAFDNSDFLETRAAAYRLKGSAL
jgi:hypothetical protein